MKTLLVTKSISEIQSLEAFCREHKINLVAESFIRFEPVKAQIPPQIEVLFFGSRRAVDFFLQQAEIPENCEIACIGPATEKHLQQLGFKVHFTGTHAGDPGSVAEELKTWLGNRRLHIAQSEQSNRSIAKALPENQVEELIVYQTIAVPKIMAQDLSLIVFTSPSNLDGFLLNNVIPGNSTIIAWGKTTEKALHTHNIKAHAVLKDSSETELIEILKDLIKA